MIKHKFKHSILACGAETKGVFSLTKGDHLFTSRDFGNLGDYSNFLRYEKAIKSDLKRFGIKPKIVACDMHPNYNSTAFADELKPDNAKLVKIQHHHAHIAGCMLDNNLSGKVIGVAFDGTGFGLDKNIWGGEFLISTVKNFKRAGHLKYIPMPGGEAAIREPWRMAAAYLRDAFGDNFIKLGIPFTKKIKRIEWQLLKNIINKKINSPLTSSAGRLFDAVASIVMLIFKVDAEAEAPIRLEELAWEAADVNGVYKSNIIKRDKRLIADLRPMIRTIVKDIKAKRAKSIIAAKFHNTMAGVISDMCLSLKRSSRIDQVVLTGGVFRNRLLTEKTFDLLRGLNFNVYTHKNIPTTDAGISTGQAMIADVKG